MIQVVRTERHVDVDENDLISVAEAARLAGRSISTIIGMMESGTLPWYQLPFGNEQRKRVPKFTSRQAVLALMRQRAQKGRRNAVKRHA